MVVLDNSENMAAQDQQGQNQQPIISNQPTDNQGVQGQVSGVTSPQSAASSDFQAPPPPPPPSGGQVPPPPSSQSTAQQGQVESPSSDVAPVGPPIVSQNEQPSQVESVVSGRQASSEVPPVNMPQGENPDQQSQGSKPPMPKKSFPKKVFLIPVAVLLLAGAVFAAIKFGDGLLNRGGNGGSGGEIVWWGLWEDEDIVQPLIEEYQQNNPGVTITYQRQSKTDYRERLTNALASGEGPDIFRIHNTWVPMFEGELDTLPSSIMSAGEYAETFYPVVVSDMTSGSGLVGIPLGIDTVALYINEEIFESFGKTPPTNWDEFRRTAIELTVYDGAGAIVQSGAALGRTENVDHWQEIVALMMSQSGVRLSNPTNTQAEDALRYYTIFATEDNVWDETLPPSTVAFANGQVAMYFGPSWRVFEIVQMNPDLRFRVVPVPQLPQVGPRQNEVTYASYWVESVWDRSESKDAAWDFLKFMSTQESLQKLYTNASQTRLFGEPYPRSDMSQLLADDPYVAPFVQQAPDATSWFLASRTFDGPTGINSQIASYFEDAINATLEGERASEVLKTVTAGVQEVLSSYNLLSSGN